MVEVNNHLIIINRVKTIVKYHKELTKAKGERFNIYNIMNLQTKEVRTHSAFLATLLNPRGSHLMGIKFLESFLKIVANNHFKDHIDIKSAKVRVEFPIGIIDDQLKTGGRIDILIKDDKQRTISIENKIDAGDGKNQIERYCNYNKDKNKVIYLSKFSGDEPSLDSSGIMGVNKDFYKISYQDEIIRWLEKCQSISYDQPILRESIKQYKILIQQITHTLGNKEDKELKAIVLNNLEEASLIASKYDQVIKKIKADFKDKVLNLLKEKIKDYTLTTNQITHKHSNIWFFNQISNVKEVWFAVESFSGSGHKDGLLFVGIFDKKGRLPSNKNFVSVTKNWVHHRPLTYNDLEIRLSSNTFLNSINTSEKSEAVAEDVVQQIIEFINEYKFAIV